MAFGRFSILQARGESGEHDHILQDICPRTTCLSFEDLLRGTFGVTRCSQWEESGEYGIRLHRIGHMRPEDLSLLQVSASKGGVVCSFMCCVPKMR